MPNILDATGLQTATRAELVEYFTGKYQTIYGSDINLDSDTPDGQMMNIFIQSILDLQDLLVQVYNMFDPDNAIGIILDQRVAINGIQRQGGTYTVTPITLVNSQSVNLYGLDQDVEDPYTIADNAGSRWLLEDTQLGLSAGTHILSFRAEVPGAQLTTPNTIDVPVTITLGVTSVNNPTTYTTLGVNEESDAELKIRRQQSVSIVSQGYLAGLLAALEAIDGMDAAFVYENNTSTTDSDGVPSHTIWVIVSGTAANADIANAIYTKRNAGAGMYGDTTYTVTQVDGSFFTVAWDTVELETLFITFVATSLDGITPPDIAAIRAGLVTSLTPGVFAAVNINQLSTLVQAIDDNCLVTGAGFSNGRSQVLTLSGVAASGAFVISYGGEASASIAWNDAVGTIQTKVRAITGLDDIVVTGSIASQTLTFDLDDVAGPLLSLLTVPTNTLQTGGAAAITLAYNEGYANVLEPTTKRNQFIVSADNIVITPMIMSPSSASLDTGDTQTFEGLGGYGAIVYSLAVNASGATIDAATGEYEAGVTPGSDTVRATDALGNTVTAVVTVA